MKKKSFGNFLLFCGLRKDEFLGVRELIWERNLKILKITSISSVVMSVFFLIFNRLTGSEIWIPYLFLAIGSTFVTLIIFLKRTKPLWLDILLCYLEILFVCIYAGILSVQESNAALPATSLIVFIALLPMSIDDRPIRMYLFMLGESALYLLIASGVKSTQAFRLDVINVITFCVIGMLFYAVICARNVREIYQNAKVEKVQSGVIRSLATVVEERDENTGGHIQRTEDYVKMLIEKMKRNDKFKKIPDQFYKNVILAAPMHDVGKIKIPDTILNKPARLTEKETEVMKLHTVYGAEILGKLLTREEDPEYFDIAQNVAKYHHEHYDGTGYPDGLKGDDIPLEARIMALADVYDALTSDRIYKKAYPNSMAREILKESAGTQFDPDLCELFLENTDIGPKKRIFRINP
ncbi:MAG: HD-GYP domain-containing protein [Clostridia bacterium]|nr:HD-GYP domain-containing protein [Clostridia bacterium]